MCLLNYLFALVFYYSELSGILIKSSAGRIENPMARGTSFAQFTTLRFCGEANHGKGLRNGFWDGVC